MGLSSSFHWVPSSKLFYNGLPHIDEVINVPLEAQAHELGNVVRKHGLQEYVGIFLGHKHFDIQDDEAVCVDMFGASASSTGINSSVPLKARVVGLDTEKLVPYSWVFRSGQWEPVQYVPASYPGIQECMDKLGDKMDVFMPDIVDKLKELQVDHLLGVALRYDRAFRGDILREMKATGKKLTLLETTNPYKRRQRFQVIEQRVADADRNMVSTFWGFDPEVEGSCDYTYACFKVHGSHQGYWGHVPDNCGDSDEDEAGSSK
ncbi:hypothetical protein GPECTOR_95g677 [Gonium pectorale]|uniref:Uncharacterized protein n=1 Tax=Gonium pectorale TaxID=33097 RepID=A0A150G0C9_GONPE|nr:hypothetical protein GPECTOR_95g677 [Gonium pectorale]|eukprot:KXZ43288.1 hypothetical protein GPECTOR_95g677 [Gonium pectorale]